MTHAHRTFSGTPQANLTAAEASATTWPVDLGNLNDLRTNGADGPVEVGIQTDAGLIEIGFGLDSVPSLLPSYFLYPRGAEIRSPETGEVAVVPQETTTPTVARTGTIGPTVVHGSTDTHYEVRRINEFQWQESGIPSLVSLDGLLLRSITHEGGTSRLLSGRAMGELEFLFQNLTYLRPTRARPLRTYPAGSSRRFAAGRALTTPDSPQEIGYSGESSAAVLHRRAEEPVHYAGLPNIPNLGEKWEISAGKSAGLVSDTLVGSVRAWLQRLRLADSLRTFSEGNSERIEVLVTLAGQSEHNIVEIGFGTSQVLPILIAGLLQPSGSVFIVDLPEAHLHPRPQADLADFFCSLALSNRFSLVETHSEMFFHRLRLRVEMDEVLKEKIAVYFIDEPKEGLCCQPRRVGLGYDEQLSWPVGFLQEAWETESQIEQAHHYKSLIK